jgi:hypothetical protein
MNDPQQVFVYRLAELHREDLIAASESKRQIAHLSEPTADAPVGQSSRPEFANAVRSWPLLTTALGLLNRLSNGG